MRRVRRACGFDALSLQPSRVVAECVRHPQPDDQIQEHERGKHNHPVKRRQVAKALPYVIHGEILAGVGLELGAKY